MHSHPAGNHRKDDEPVSSGELSAWRRGFTPQAEIWNGRMAMFGVAVGLTLLIALNATLGK